jgi:hypothetical protein
MSTPNFRTCPITSLLLDQPLLVASMQYLTPGDFATVKRQCLVLDTTLSPEEWLDQLEMECQIKGAVPRVEASPRAA